MGKTIKRRRLLRSITARTRSTSARPKRAGAIHEAIQPFFGENPLVLTRGTRVLLRGKEYVYPLEMLQVLTGVSPLLSFRIIFDYLIATLKSTLAPAKKEHSFEEWGVRNLGPHALRLVLRHLLRARLGIADLADFVEAGAAGREAESEEHHPADARHQGRSGDLLHEVHVSAQGHQRAVREHGRGRPQARHGDAARLASRPSRARRRADRARRVSARADARRRSNATACCRRCRCRRSSICITPALPASVAEHAKKLRYRSLKLIYIALKRDAADRLPLGLSARRAVPRQPHVGAEERQHRNGAAAIAPSCASSCRAGATSRCGTRPTKRSTESR